MTRISTLGTALIVVLAFGAGASGAGAQPTDLPAGINGGLGLTKAQQATPSSPPAGISRCSAPAQPQAVTPSRVPAPNGAESGGINWGAVGLAGLAALLLLGATSVALRATQRTRRQDPDTV